MNADKRGTSPCHIRISSVFICVYVWFFVFSVAAAPAPVARNKAAQQYLRLLENFSGWAEQHWNDKEQSFDAKGAGVTWPRGNGDVCLVYAVLLTELPNQATFSPRKVPREVMLDHVRRTLRSLCLHDKNCTDPNAIKPATWGGPNWQSSLETEHWVFAAHLLADQLDDQTKALVKQVATAEADVSEKPIPNGTQGDTAADDAALWNARGWKVLSLPATATIPKPRRYWDEWAKTLGALKHGKPRRAGPEKARSLSTANRWENGLSPRRPIPISRLKTTASGICHIKLLLRRWSSRSWRITSAGSRFRRHMIFTFLKEGDMLKWLTLADGDLAVMRRGSIGPSWMCNIAGAYAELGTLFDQSWARAAEARCSGRLLYRPPKCLWRRLDPRQ